MTSPLLVIDGDSFAHRSYHALPKTIRRRGNKGGGAIVGFANFLSPPLRDRAAKGGAGRLGTASTSPPTGMKLSPPIRAAANSTTSWSISLTSFPSSSPPAGSPTRRLLATRPTISWQRPLPRSERRGTVLVATGDRDAYQLASTKTTILQPIKAGEMARIGPAEVRERYGVEPAQVPDFIALRGDASDKIPGAKGVGPKTAAGLLVKYGSLEKLLAAGRFAARPTSCDFIAPSRRWTGRLPCPPSRIRSRRGPRRRRWRANGN